MSTPPDIPPDTIQWHRRRLLITVAGIVLGVLLVVIGVVYVTQTANNLPSFFPGHVADATTLHHYRHAIAAFVLALGAFALAWFSSGPASAKQK
jgi:amino acid permease